MLGVSFGETVSWGTRLWVQVVGLDCLGYGLRFQVVVRFTKVRIRGTLGGTLSIGSPLREP